MKGNDTKFNLFQQSMPEGMYSEVSIPLTFCSTPLHLKNSAAAATVYISCIQIIEYMSLLNDN